ncbi:hypothetical protein [Bradyrhizobium sp. Tv2a-2]|uniref:hypothetical protein n=1 Tax=Bradyrhizobium sp. Tv2a-2 TaxID=113395 RepID=UPI000427C30B|nr:hypothetical protein [Bradyrhizobium sp. Tv2a-2]
MKKLLLIALLLLAPATAYADQTINTLGAGSAVSNTDLFPAYQGANPATTPTAAQVKAYSNISPGYVASNWYVPINEAASSIGQGVTSSTIYCKFGIINQKVTISALAIGINTAGSSNVQLAVYSSVNGKPGSLLSNTANIANNVTGAVSGALGANKQVGPGGANGDAALWFCANTNDSTMTPVISGFNALSGAAYVGSSTLSDILNGTGGTSIGGVSCSGANCNGGSSTFNTWPASLAGSTWTIINSNTTGNPVPIVGFKVQSVP